MKGLNHWFYAVRASSALFQTHEYCTAVQNNPSLSEHLFTAKFALLNPLQVQKLFNNIPKEASFVFVSKLSGNSGPLNYTSPHRHTNINKRQCERWHQSLTTWNCSDVSILRNYATNSIQVLSGMHNTKTKWCKRFKGVV